MKVVEVVCEKQHTRQKIIGVRKNFSHQSGTSFSFCFACTPLKDKLLKNNQSIHSSEECLIKNNERDDASSQAY